MTPDWFRVLVGDTVDFTEIRGWRKTGRSKQMNPSFTELKTVRCIIDGPQWEDIYNITKMPNSSSGDKMMAFTSSMLEGEMKSGTRTEFIDETMEEQKESDEILKSVVTHEVLGRPTWEKISGSATDLLILAMKAAPTEIISIGPAVSETKAILSSEKEKAPEEPYLPPPEESR